MEKYDPLSGPDPKEWLALGEGERLALVETYHRTEKVQPMGREMHAICHVAVETQVAMGDETPARAALARLMGEGLDRHDAIHAIGAALALYIYAVAHDDESETLEKYYERIRTMTAASWREMGKQ